MTRQQVDVELHDVLGEFVVRLADCRPNPLEHRLHVWWPGAGVAHFELLELYRPRRSPSLRHRLRD